MSAPDQSSNARPLFLARFRQCGFTCRHTEHWGLFLAKSWDQCAEGTLFHVVYSGNPTVSASVHAVTGSYSHGYFNVPKFHPNTSGQLTGLSSIITAAQGGISASTLHQVSQAIDAQFPYNIANNNCQNFVIRVLQELHKQGKVTTEALSSVAGRVGGTVFTPSAGNWATA
ncbi:TPA_exp: Uncharacterized protein A8136_3127 [Trichophyton benhamiae CBS 112371]|uniref:Uncharacterized protein n=1 Tax=Arthroderma benhamiae (strain ATCC MYA-4681 / CBS 112371) TaxID=663331 RepID=D4AZG0_ARTBC|nr:uncharacterized protein ARB_01578 [Trichophyton benhamiae CBS 112371]EFE31430.1 hypothetical protein ARB_01578 [Trichophyton benhamiae CBS 112371]DAA74589.1 TPA_exp: Uncharacterized protein A8136_3127 [Trichophyton benhamiae CBS 112371]